MRKKLLILAAILSVIAVYSSVWFVQGQRLKSLTIRMLDDIATELHTYDMEFLYSHVGVSGFPFHFDIYVHQPRFLGGANDDFPVDVASHGPLVLRSNFLVTSLTLRLPQELAITHNAFEEVKNYHLQFLNTPSANITLAFEQPYRRYWSLLSKKVELEPFLTDTASLKTLTLDIKGLSLAEANSGKALILSGPLAFSHHITALNTQSNTLSATTSLHIEKIKTPPLVSTDDAPQSAESFNAKISLDTILPANTALPSKSNLHLKKFYIENEHFSITGNGDVKGATVDHGMQGNITLGINHHDAAIDYFYGALDTIFKDVEWLNPIRAKDITHRNAIKRGLVRIADNGSDEAESLIFTLHRQDEDEIHYGDYAHSEAVDIFKAEQNKRKKAVNGSNTASDNNNKEEQEAAQDTNRSDPWGHLHRRRR